MVDLAHLARISSRLILIQFLMQISQRLPLHKTLRGPRGGMILTNDEALAKKINSAVFPGIQGGPRACDCG